MEISHFINGFSSLKNKHISANESSIGALCSQCSPSLVGVVARSWAVVGTSTIVTGTAGTGGTCGTVLVLLVLGVVVVLLVAVVVHGLLDFRLLFRLLDYFRLLLDYVGIGS